MVFFYGIKLLDRSRKTLSSINLLEYLVMIKLRSYRSETRPEKCDIRPFLWCFFRVLNSILSIRESIKSFIIKSSILYSIDQRLAPNSDIRPFFIYIYKNFLDQDWSIFRLTIFGQSLDQDRLVT